MTFIDPNQADQSHIDLYCVNHPELRWFTKNIDFIGARGIFFDPGDDFTGVECKCPLSDLRVRGVLKG